MINNSHRQQQNIKFGWNRSTHKAITRKAAEQVNKLSENLNGKLNVEALVKASILPDKVEKDKPHVADIDYPQIEDGLTLFKSHNKWAEQVLSNGNRKQFLVNASKAAHYAIDIICTPHVKVKKAKEGKRTMEDHRIFENDAVKYQDEIIENAALDHKKSEIDIQDFIIEKMREAKNIKLKKDSGEITLKESIEESMKIAYDVMFEYLSSVSNKLEQNK